MLMFKLFRFKHYIEEKRKQRFIQMSKELRKLSDVELKDWYIHADTQRILGNMCADERKLFQKIEEELERRGFEFMTDY